MSDIPKGIRLSEKKIITTSVGELIPAYTTTHRRKNKHSVQFYKDGAVKAVALEEAQQIQTPIGEFSAELVTFYETGELNRFFPLDGQISGMWSEEEEKALTTPLSFDLLFTTFTAIINGVGFYQSGKIRSITLFPGETITIKTQYGNLPVRNGFSMYATGELESLEPAVPISLQTNEGKITAFDNNAVGINADINSLVFDKQGKIISYIDASVPAHSMCEPDACEMCSMGCKSGHLINEKNML